MSNRYTAEILNGISFATFAKNCAWAFGAYVTLRDEVVGSKVILKQVGPSDCHKNAATKAREELDNLLRMTPEQCEEAATKSWQDKEKRFAETIKKTDETRKAYEAMREQVVKWKPPTQDHLEFKQFMLSQIDESIKHDCCLPSLVPPPRYSGSEWRGYEEDRLRRDIIYHDDKYAQEVTGCKTHLAWVQALIKSLTGGSQ